MKVLYGFEYAKQVQMYQSMGSIMRAAFGGKKEEAQPTANFADAEASLKAIMGK